MKKGLLVVMICLLGLVVFAGLAVYGWNLRYGPAEGVLPESFPTLSVPFVARSIKLAPDTGPADAVWQDLPGVQVSLMHQVMAKPWPQGHTPAVSVQSFHDGEYIYFRLSWKDDQADTAISPGKFADACAVALPVKSGSVPRSIMMGFSDLVNFWHWRADMDAEFWHGKSPDLPAYSDYHTPFEKTEVDPTIITKVDSAVTDLLASRPGALTRKKHQLVQGAGVWADGTWSVVFKRALTTEHTDADSQIKPGKYFAAFAVWDGDHGDRGGRKSLSDWVVLDIAPVGAPAPAGLLSGSGGGAVLGLATARGADATTAQAPPTPALTNVGGPETPRVITVTAKRFEFTPSTIELDEDELVTLRLESLDVTHGLYLDGYGIRLKARPGLVDKATFRADKTGRFSFRCAETCGEFHPYMIGYLSVTPNRRFHIFVALALATCVLLGVVFTISSSRNKGEPSDPNPPPQIESPTPIDPADLAAAQSPPPPDCDQGKLLGLIPLKWRFDVTSLPLVRRLFKSRWFPLAAILVNLSIFSIILYSGVAGGFSSGNFSFGVMIVWILWYVMLMTVLVPAFSRTWCMVCPLPSFGEWLQRLRILGVNDKSWGLGLKWPRWLSNMWLMNVLFLSTTFFSGFFTVKPLATFYLLGGIIVLGIVLSLVFEKRNFCLYVCPVSGFQGLYSNMAMTEIRVKDPAICAKHKNKTCEIGNKKGYGCPWLLQPYDLKRNTYCGMCLECFKTCPFDNMAMNIRPPGTDILVPRKRGFDEAWKSFIMLGIAIMFYAAMMGRWGWLKEWVRGASLGGWLTFVALHTAVCLLVIPAVYTVFAVLSKRFSGAKEISMRAVFVNLSYCLIPMGMAAWIAFSFGFLLPNGSYILHVLSDPFGWGWDLFGTAGAQWTPVLTAWLVPLQYGALFLGYLVSAYYGYRLARQTYLAPKAALRGFMPLLAFLTIVVLFFGWLYGG